MNRAKIKVIFQDETPLWLREMSYRNGKLYFVAFSCEEEDALHVLPEHVEMFSTALSKKIDCTIRIKELLNEDD